MEELIEKIKEYKIIVICAILGLVLGGFFLLKPVAQTPAKETKLQTEVTTVSKDSTEEKEDKNQKEEVVEQDLITVDVKGAVKSPGIYDLPVGSRINDAVQKAGGLTDNADSKSINLAQRISDEALVYIPTKEEATSQEAQSNASNTKENKKVNLNKASLEELKQVKGLGSKRAQDIIDHRESNGKFKSVDELKKVSGIGAKTIEKLKEYVTVDYSISHPQNLSQFSPALALLCYLFSKLFSTFGLCLFTALPLFSISMEDCGQGSLCLWSFWKLVYISKMAARRSESTSC